MAASSVIAPAVAQLESTDIVQMADVRMPATALSTSAEMKEAMIEEEGVRYTVYRDAAGFATVGVGHLVQADDGLAVGEKLTRDAVLDLFETDLAYAEQVVERLAGDTPLYQHEFDALVDLAFNVGEGSLSAANSPKLNAAIALRDHDGIAAELDYLRAGSIAPAGLEIRSERRVAIFTAAEYDNPRDVASA